MELDKRIKEGKRPLDCFDVDIAKQFIGKKGYFSNSLGWYSVLKSTWDGTLDDIESQQEKCFYDCESEGYFYYFLPAEWVKKPEKQYRPYKNVQELFEDIGVYIGDTIYFRSKAKGTESYSLITSYTTLKDGTEKICLGGAFYYTMQALFDLFELHSRGEWIPFGIEE